MWLDNGLLSLVYIPHPRIIVNSDESCFLLILSISLTGVIGSAFSHILRPNLGWLWTWVPMSAVLQHLCNKRRIIFSILPLMYMELHVAIEIIFYFLSIQIIHMLVEFKHPL